MANMVNSLNERCLQFYYHMADLHCHRPYRGQVLTARHRQNRLNWTLAHRQWRQEWERVVFSDECRFVVNSIDNRVRVWRPRGERFNNRYVLQQDAWPAQSSNKAVPTANQQELRRQWGRVPPAFLNRLVNSMPNRCQLVIRNAGGHTRY
nr:hypothetical protein BaRGS_029334 [Batillaria attramentaria]